MTTTEDLKTDETYEFCHCISVDIANIAIRSMSSPSKSNKKQPFQRKQEAIRAAVKAEGKEFRRPIEPNHTRKPSPPSKIKPADDTPRFRSSQSPIHLTLHPTSPGNLQLPNSLDKKQPLNSSPQKTPVRAHSSLSKSEQSSPAHRLTGAKLRSMTSVFTRFESFLGQCEFWVSGLEPAQISRVTQTRVQWEESKPENSPEKCIKILNDLEEFLPFFPKDLMETYADLKQTLEKTREETESSIAQTRMEAQQAINAISYKKIHDVRSVRQPIPELVSASLLVYRFLSRIYPPLSHQLGTQTWKSFQAYIQQPAEFQSALKAGFAAVEAGAVSQDAIQELKETCAKVSDKNLHSFDETGSGTLFLRYAACLARYWEAMREEDTKVKETPTFLGSGSADRPSRRKLLSSLYQRVFSAAPKCTSSQYLIFSTRNQSEQVARIFQSPEKPVSLDLNSVPTTLDSDPNQVPEISILKIEESETDRFLRNLSFDQEETSVPATANHSPERVAPETLPTPRISTKIPVKRSLKVAPRSKSRTQIASNPRKIDQKRSREDQISACGMKHYWELENAFRKFLHGKIQSDSWENLCKMRVSILAEFQGSVSQGKKADLSPRLAAELQAKSDLLFACISEEHRFREEVRQAFLILQRQQRVQRQKALNWMQQELVREKVKLAQEMERFTKSKC